MIFLLARPPGLFTLDRSSNILSEPLLRAPLLQACRSRDDPPQFPNGKQRTDHQPAHRRRSLTRFDLGITNEYFWSLEVQNLQFRHGPSA